MTPIFSGSIIFCRLLQCLDVLLKACIEGNQALNSCIGDLLQEIFKGGPQIALAVKERQIVTMMYLLFDKSTQNPSLMSALMQLLMVSDCSRKMKRNDIKFHKPLTPTITII